MALSVRLRATLFLVASALGACAPATMNSYDTVPLDDPVLGGCVDSRKSKNFVYGESDRIVVILEPGDLAEYRRALPAQFAMPERPLIRVGILDFYSMVSGPTYMEAEVSVLGLHEGRPGWFILTLPVNDGDSCARGRQYVGYPKVMRRITLERGANRYVGTLYALGARTPEITLTVEIGEPDDAALQMLASVPLPQFTMLDGRVNTVAGSGRSVAELQRVGALEIKFGKARLEHSRAPESALQRLQVGKPVLAYYALLRSQQIAPR